MNVERVVQTALALAHQPELIETIVERPANDRGPQPAFRLPRLTGSWARTTEGLAHPSTRELRPITFDHEVAAGHDDVVLAHLGHRLVVQAVWLLRAEVWAVGTEANLARATARIIPDGIVDEVAIIAHGRLVITGADGHRLHEEVVAAGGLVRNRRFARIPTVGQVGAILDTPTLGVPPLALCQELAQNWPALSEALLTSLVRRQQERAESLAAVLARRADEDARAVVEVLEELARSIRTELGNSAANLQLSLPLFAADERIQVERDLDALRRRLKRNSRRGRSGGSARASPLQRSDAPTVPGRY